MPDAFTDHDNLTETEFLEQYHVQSEHLVTVSVDTVIFGVELDHTDTNYRHLEHPKLEVLLTKRSSPPFKDKWALPGGFVNKKETLENTASRLIKEKIGLRDLYLEQLHAFGDDSDRDPRTRVISCAYLSLIDYSKYLEVKNNRETESRWFVLELSTKQGYLRLSNQDETFFLPLTQVTQNKGRIVTQNWQAPMESPLAFDHAEMILEALLRLRNKILYTDIIFNLMGDKFSISHLQMIHEIILGEKLLAPAFRRKIAHKIAATREFTGDRGHRPSQLFTYNRNWQKNKALGDLAD